MKKTFERLHDKILADLGLDVVDLKRTHAGVHMRASGAFSWRGYLKNSRNFEIGGCDPANEYIKKDVKIGSYPHNQLGSGSLEIMID